MVVGIFKTLTQNVTNYVDYQWQNAAEKLTSESIPDLSLLEKVQLEQGRAYRFRIAGVNACGVGKFSEVRKWRKKFQFESKINFKSPLGHNIQNLPARIPRCTLRHQNHKITRRCSSQLGTTITITRRNHRIFSLSCCQGSKSIKSYTACIYTCLCR